MKAIAANIDSSITILFITLVPCSILLCTTGDIFIKLLYERGAFQVRETFLTQRALFGYSLGLLFYGLSISFVRVFNAFHDMKTPAIIGVTAIVINVILDWVLMIPFGNMGISLATSIVSLYNFSMLMIFLKKRMHYKTSKRTVRDIARSIFAGIILLFSIIMTRYAIGERVIMTFVITTLLTCGIYFIAFKNYYLMYLKKGR
jgi:putative peptidoglycan lipid II flippase